MTTKKEHAVGSGIGASVGTIAGGALGAVAGPASTISVAVIGAQIGDTAAEILNPTAHLETFKFSYQNKPYYSAGRTWDDYATAYGYGDQSQFRFRGMGFEEIEQSLAEDWPNFKQNSRLTWAEAREAVREGWQLGRENALNQQDGPSQA